MMNIGFKETLEEDGNEFTTEVTARSEYVEINTSTTFSLQALIKIQAQLARAERRLRDNGAEVE